MKKLLLIFGLVCFQSLSFGQAVFPPKKTEFSPPAVSDIKHRDQNLNAKSRVKRNRESSFGMAPNFELETRDGTKLNLSVLTKDKALFVLFIDKGCPMTAGALKFYDAIARAYSNKVNFVGIINADKNAFDVWQSRVMRLSFPLLLNPQMHIIRAFGVIRSPALLQVDEKEVTGAWPVYSRDIFHKINLEAAKAAGDKPVKIDFTDCIKMERTGCAFFMR